MYSSSPLCAAISPSTFLNENCWGIPSGPGPAYSSTLVTWRSQRSRRCGVHVCRPPSGKTVLACASLSVPRRTDGRWVSPFLTCSLDSLARSRWEYWWVSFYSLCVFNSVRLTFDHRCIKHESCLLYNLSGEAVGGSPSFCVQVDMSHGIHHVETWLCFEPRDCPLFTCSRQAAVKQRCW